MCRATPRKPLCSVSAALLLHASIPIPYFPISLCCAPHPIPKCIKSTFAMGHPAIPLHTSSSTFEGPLATSQVSLPFQFHLSVLTYVQCSVTPLPLTSSIFVPKALIRPSLAGDGRPSPNSMLRTSSKLPPSEQRRLAPTNSANAFQPSLHHHRPMTKT